MKKIFVYLFSLLLTPLGYAQIPPIMIEAEDAAIIGSDYSEVVEGDTVYLTPSTDRAEGDGPMLSDKLLSFNIPFQASGSYHLYIKLRVGPDGPNDDSFWLASTLGDKDPEEPTDWLLVNNIQNGASHPDSVVLDAATGVGNGIFKWVNASLIGGGDSPVETKYEVSAAGSEVYIYGSRENALDIDKIAFAEAGAEYTVAELEAGGPDNLSSPGAEINALKVYPNPANDVLRVSFTNKPESQVSINIYGQTGALVKSIFLNDQITNLNIEELTSGIYLMRVFYNGRQITQKFIVK
jgi:hypothetical protein